MNEQLIRDQIYFLRLLYRVDSNVQISLTGQSKWVDPFGVMRNPPVKPIIARSILRNELVLEIDDDNWNIVRDGSKAVVRLLERWGAEYYLSFSGNRSIHIHVFFNANKIDISQDTQEALADVEKEEVRKALKQYVMRQIALASSTIIDMNLSSKHLIRLEGSANEKSGKYCTQIHSISDEKPSKYEVRVPDSLPPLWDITFLQDELNAYFKIHFTRKEPNISYYNFTQLTAPEKLIETLRPVYIPNYRHSIIFSVSGIFKKHGVEYDKAKQLIRRLANPDPTPLKTSYTIKEVYRQSNPRKIPGITRLKEVVKQEINDGKITPSVAEDVLNKVREALS